MSALVRTRNWLVVTITGLALAGPALGLDKIAAPDNNPEKADGDCAKDEISVKGTVEHVELEGGFWGVIADGDWSIFRRFQPSITLALVRKHGPIPFASRPVNGYTRP